MQFDTGADHNNIKNQLNLTQPSQIPRDVSCNILKLIGQRKAEVMSKGKVITVALFVTSHNYLNIMGADVMNQLGIWSYPIEPICNDVSVSEVQQYKDKFPNVFVSQPGPPQKLPIRRKIPILPHISCFSFGRGFVRKSAAIISDVAYFRCM